MHLFAMDAGGAEAGHEDRVAIKSRGARGFAVPTDQRCRSAAKLLTKDDARRIAVSIAKLPVLVRQR
jgi:hypothetical protein